MPTNSQDDDLPHGLSRRTMLSTAMLIAAGLSVSQVVGWGAESASAAIPWQHPFTFRGHISSSYGSRIDPVTQQPAFHNGTDYSGPPSAGTSIYPVAAGTVIASGYNATGFGNNVTIQHADGYRSLYGHMLDGTRLPQGAVVTPTTVVGKVGSTGKSTGAHLHLEISLNGVRRDPAPLVQNAPLAGTIQTPPTQMIRGQDMYVTTATNGSAYLITPFGVVGITDPAHRDLFIRLLNSPANGQVFLQVEVDTMARYINSLVR
jgi:hypothetical protein